MAAIYKVVMSLYASTFKTLSEQGAGKTKNNTILMGSFVKLLAEETGAWQRVKAFGIEGWIEKIHLGDSPGLKIFFVDVGQGDSALIEAGNDHEGVKILIDGGPGDNLSRYLSKWQYRYYFDRGEKVHFDYIFVSHFDKDHYQGLIDIINDEHYTFGTIFHNGIAKFNNEKETFPPEYNTELGIKTKVANVRYLTTTFNTIEDFTSLKNKGGMLDLLEKFEFAVKNAKQQGRLKDFKRIDHTSSINTMQINNKAFGIEILGPVTSQLNNQICYKYFEDEAHTINGHSLVLKIKYGARTFLFGGDLNIPSEDHLLHHYNTVNPFETDVAKSCHHGASEFTTSFMAKVNPLATVISSGDNETYSHPRADAIGCAENTPGRSDPWCFRPNWPDQVMWRLIRLNTE